MKPLAVLAFLAIVTTSAAAGRVPKKQTIAGWGIALDPAGDCNFKTTGGTLTITVPGTAKPHDLSPELASVTAPRVVRPVSGDFTIQVRVDGRFKPDISAESMRTPYTGAGLVVFADARSFVRIERAALRNRKVWSYTNFEIRVNGELERFGTGGDFPTKNKTMWLRLTRRGHVMLGAMSQDGRHWIYGKSKQLRGRAWNRNHILAGVAAVNDTLKTFSPTYSEFSIHPTASPKN